MALPHGCSCKWLVTPNGRWEYLADRDAECERHGDDTTWWADISNHGKQLSRETKS